ncbi:hypothetical protein J6590_088660 [Homalodisca vitripennis]|nr:hypothetical protein J6590_088660 [Homalodisca vitripennis]
MQAVSQTMVFGPPEKSMEEEKSRFLLRTSFMLSRRPKGGGGIAQNLTDGHGRNKNSVVNKSTVLTLGWFMFALNIKKGPKGAPATSVGGPMPKTVRDISKESPW